MRIIAGSLRGREIKLPKNSRIRPATGFVREKLMNLYTPQRLAAGGFADLCAGSGLIGFEALSRGAQWCVFVEVDVQTVEALRDNADKFGVREQTAVLRCDARRCWSRIATTVERYGALSCLSLDAPYIPGMAQDLLERFGHALGGGDLTNCFTDDALLIARTPDRLRPERFGALTLLEERSAGGRDKLYLFTPA